MQAVKNRIFDTETQNYVHQVAFALLFVILYPTLLLIAEGLTLNAPRGENVNPLPMNDKPGS